MKNTEYKELGREIRAIMMLIDFENCHTVAKDLADHYPILAEALMNELSFALQDSETMNKEEKNG